MLLRFRHRARGAAGELVLRPLLAAACVFALAGCGPDGGPSLIAGQPRGATVAFDSIDGPPPAQFKQLVKNLDAEAKARHLAVTSRDKPAAYRVRGYLAAETGKGKTTISWVWDVFDRDQHRVLRVSGAQSEQGRRRDAWSVVNDAMLQRIARGSMNELAAFLTSRKAAPGAPTPAPAAVSPAIALFGNHRVTPEEAGIVPIAKPQASSQPQSKPAPAHRRTALVPIPRIRPAKTTTLASARETVLLAASSHADGRRTENPAQ